MVEGNPIEMKNYFINDNNCKLFGVRSGIANAAKRVGVLIIITVVFCTLCRCTSADSLEPKLFYTNYCLTEEKLHLHGYKLEQNQGVEAWVKKYDSYETICYLNEDKKVFRIVWVVSFDSLNKDEIEYYFLNHGFSIENIENFDIEKRSHFIIIEKSNPSRTFKCVLVKDKGAVMVFAEKER